MRKLMYSLALLIFDLFLMFVFYYVTYGVVTSMQGRSSFAAISLLIIFILSGGYLLGAAIYANIKLFKRISLIKDYVDKRALVFAIVAVLTLMSFITGAVSILEDVDIVFDSPYAWSFITGIGFSILLFME